jgi:transposase
MNKLSRVGIDLAKNLYQLHGVDRNEQTVWRRRLTRRSWLKVLLEKVEPGCEIGMEACAGAHHWARQLQAKGFTVKLIAPQFVKPYVKSNKNDANDAEAICEAMSRPHMRFVAVKSIEQQDIQAVHRIRSGLLSQRTAKANQIRGLVALTTGSSARDHRRRCDRPGVERIPIAAPGPCRNRNLDVSIRKGHDIPKSSSSAAHAVCSPPVINPWSPFPGTLSRMEITVSFRWITHRVYIC